MRTEFWGYAAGESLDNAALIAERYVGHPTRARLSRLPRSHREGERCSRCSTRPARAGIRLTESYAMWPAASVSGWYFSHPEARYFGLGRIGRDQAADYARRKGMDVRAMERWLAPVLGYDPDA